MQNTIVTKQEDVYQNSCSVFRMNGERTMIDTNGQTFLTHKRKVEEEENTGGQDITKKSLPPNGKKTKGRVKIKMEFIDNKLRRYTTFSKRKTGIMKKAYELSTLTGTQVMLLVASETGHVYTFATRKLQPMITSEAGKALIQTCLNSPDPPGGISSSGPDQRMSATGFEETDLTYSVNDELDKDCGKNQYNSGASTPETLILGNNGNATTITTTSLSSPLPLATVPVLTASSPTTSSPSAVSMQLHQTAGFATFLAQASGTLTPGTAVQIGTFQNQSSNVQQTQNQAVYRLNPTVVSIPSVGHTTTSGSSPNQQSTMTVVPTSQQNLSVVSGNMMIPAQAVTPTTTAAVMYQTNQGLVYATPTTTTSLPDNLILNLGQQEQGNTTQQFITIPVPVSLTPSQQQQLVQGSMTNNSSLAENSTLTELVQKHDKHKK